jgi:hypothetical protein
VLRIRCCGNVFTKPLTSNDMGIHIRIHGLLGGIYDVRRWNALRCYDICAKFHKDWFSHSELNEEHSDLTHLFRLFKLNLKKAQL